MHKTGLFKLIQSTVFDGFSYFEPILMGSDTKLLLYPQQAGSKDKSNLPLLAKTQKRKKKSTKHSVGPRALGLFVASVIEELV